jgi:tRNA(Ile)-lysidine synthase
LTGEGKRFSLAFMPRQDAAPVTAAEFKALFADLEAFPVLLLAVSGGPDSTALMWLAAHWRHSLKKKPALVAITIDHGLRAESAREAAAVASLARKLGIAHRTLRWTERKPKTGLPQAARAARYRLLANAAREAQASHILTAHTLDDQAETVLIRLARGSGITGLAAMQRVSVIPVRPSEPAGQGRTSPESVNPDQEHRFRARGLTAAPRKDAIVLIRPLLDVPKARLIATLEAAKIPYVEDPSNSDPRFTRARLRGLMPALAREGLDARRLSILARRLKRADLALEAAADRAMAELAKAMPQRIAFQAQGFLHLDNEIALRLIGRAIARLGDEGPVELGKLEALKAALDAAQAGGARFRRSLAGALVTLSPGEIAVERAPPRHGRTLTTCKAGRAARRKTR